MKTEIINSISLHQMATDAQSDGKAAAAHIYLSISILRGNTMITSVNSQ